MSTVVVGRIPALAPRTRAGTGIAMVAPWLSARLPWLLLASSLVTFCYGVTTIRSAPLSQFGLLAGASPCYALSILCAAAAFAVTIRKADTAAAVAAIGAMIVCQRLPRTVSTDVPMYAWTYKHLGVVDYIHQNHHLAHGVDVYNGWPGLFAMTAWFSDASGVPPIQIAHWFTPVFHLAMAGLIYAAARAWQLTVAQGLVASFLVVTLNWVEQDYFAPQATAMILTAAIIMLLGLSQKRPTAVPILLLLFAAIAITHQLTPYWLFLLVCLLIAVRKVKPWWVIIPMAAILLGVFFYNFDITHRFTMFSLNVIGNATTNNPRVGSAGQVFTSAIMRALSITMWTSTAIALFVRWRAGKPTWALGILALSPILILGGQGYGGEAVFRVFLYSLPGCALVLAPALHAGLRARTGRFIGSLSVVVLITAASAQAYFGSWATNLLSPAQVDAADKMLAQGDFPAYLTPLAPVWPERSSGKYVQYANFDDKYDHSMIFQPQLLGMDFHSAAEYDTFMSLVDTRTDASTYVVLTEPMAMYGAYFGLFPFDAVRNLRDRLEGDPRWETVRDDRDVGVYLHRIPGR